MDETKQADEPRIEYATKLRTHTCGELRIEDTRPRRERVRPSVVDDADRLFRKPGAAAEVKLAGYVHAKRADDEFLIRDCYGMTLVRAAPDALPYVAERFRKLCVEDVVQVVGKVVPWTGPRVESLTTGEVCVEASKIEVLSAAQPLPDSLAGAEVSTDDRLTYRQLYLRRPEVQARIALRQRGTRAIREFLEGKRFLEIETPQFFWYDKVSVIPEPVPIGDGKAFALASGPIVLDQYIKPAGFDRTYQFMHVTRRETDPTPFHAQEHSVLDINMSYVEAPDMYTMVERMLAHVWKAALGTELSTPFPRISFEDAMARYGTDRVDARFGLLAAELPAAGPNGRAIRVPGGGKLGEDALAALGRAARETKPRWAKSPAAVSFARLPARTDASAALKPEGSAAPLFDKNPERLKALGAEDGDLIAVVTAADPETARAAAAEVRAGLAKALDLVPEGAHAFVWVHSYPFLQKDVRGNYTPSAVVFAGPREEDRDLISMMKSHPEKKSLARSAAFDLVLDGLEVATGYIGTGLGFQRSIWNNLFDIGTADLVRLRAPIEAHRFGVPPHGGMNIGIERLFALMAGATALDEVMIFPKDRDCKDRLLQAPTPLPPEAAGKLVEAPVAPAKATTDIEFSEEVVKL